MDKEYDLSYGNFTLKIARRPKYVILKVLIPIVFLNILNLLVFLIPADCGERLSYAITVLLALKVFLTYVNESLPRSSDPMSVLSYYLLSSLAISIFVCFLSIVIVHLNSSKHASISAPRWLSTLLCLRPISPQLSSETSGGRNTMQTPCDGGGAVEPNANNDTKTPVSNLPTWTDVTHALNTISAIFCFVCQLVATTAYFVFIINGH
jgi:hypothetical protein